tara:strand:- start:223 stop:570 length:348 start_codon:yes stop_codon:yes gene_type:complete
MKTKIKRVLFYLFTCILVRTIIVILSKYLNKNNLKIMGYLTLIPAIGFILIYLTGSRKTGIEVKGNKIWWNNLRPVHSLLYFIFSFMAINKNQNSWMILLIDVMIGFFAFIYKIL